MIQPVPAPDVLIPECDLARRVEEMAGQVSEDLNCRDLVAVVALRGGMIFASDLVRKLPDLACIDFIQARSYGSGTESTGQVEIVRDVENAVVDRDVLLIDDIVDTGLTSARLLEHLQSLGARSAHLVTLLDKPSRRRTRVEPLAVGFTVPDVFVVGYGMDYDQRYRHLPFVGVLPG